jgi:CRP-like cAMP-binding protein
MRGRYAAALTLGGVPLFSGLSKKELAEVARHTDRVSLRAGASLAREGELGREAFVILTGTAEVRRKGRKVAELGPGDVVGEMSVVGHTPRTASVTVTTDMTALVMTSQEFSAVIDANPKVAVKVLRGVAARYAELAKTV